MWHLTHDGGRYHKCEAIPQFQYVTCSGTHVTGAHLWQNSCHRWQKRCHLWHLFCHRCAPVTCVNVTIIHCDILDLLVILEQKTFRGKFDSTRTTDLCNECERTLSSYKKQQVVHRHCTLTLYTILHCVEQCGCTVHWGLCSVQWGQRVQTQLRQLWIPAHSHNHTEGSPT